MDKTKITREDIAKRFKEANFLDFKKINVRMGMLQNIGACHLNARQGIESGDYSIAAKVILMAPTGLLRVHWVNKDDLGYIDNTLGYMSQDKGREYFLVMQYSLADLENTDMVSVQDDAKREFIANLYSHEELKTMEYNLLDL
jgi:hypothetical protein